MTYSAVRELLRDVLQKYMATNTAHVLNEAESRDLELDMEVTEPHSSGEFTVKVRDTRRGLHSTAWEYFTVKVSHTY